MLPNLFKHPNGVYYVRKMINGRRVKISTGCREEKAAQRRYHELMVKLDKQGPPHPAEKPTFDEWWQTYEQHYTTNKRSPHVDRMAARYANTIFVRRKLTDITPSLCQRLMNDMRKSLKPSTAVLYGRQLKTMFRAAVDEGLLERNPWRAVELDKKVEPVAVLTSEDQQKLHAALNAEYQRWLIVMVGTGLRLSESLALTAADVDLHRHLLHVRAGKGGRPREVPLAATVETVLAQQLAIRPTGKLFPKTKQTAGAALARGCKRAGIGHLHPHQLRHTFATRWLQTGGDIYVLSKILGHASVTTTERIYVHLLKEDIVKLSGLRDVAQISGPTVNSGENQAVSA